MRRFAIIGSLAPSSGNISLEDLPGHGRIDVICRNIGSCLLLSHGIRNDTEVVVHLLGGPGKPRRIRFTGSKITGLRADERSIAGRIRKILSEPLPPSGVWKEVSSGVSHSGGPLAVTLQEWRRLGVHLYTLDADGLPLDSIHETPSDSGYILGDHRPLDNSNFVGPESRISLGKTWLLGSACITIIHHWLDNQPGSP